MDRKARIIVRVGLLGVLLVGFLASNRQFGQAAPLQQDMPPVIPVRIFGTVQTSGTQLPAHTEISAWIDNKLYATTQMTVTQGMAVYVIDVPADNPNTPTVIERGPEGKTILFKINRARAKETTIWHAGALIELNLTTMPVTSTPAAAVASGGAFYQVQPGDTLSAIARRYSVTVSALVQANGLRSANYIDVGQPIYLPLTTQAPSCVAYYEVTQGDTLSQIAAHFGVDYYRLAQANGLANPNYIYVGQPICIPNIYAGG